MHKQQKLIRPIMGPLRSPQSKLHSLDTFKPNTTKNSQLSTKSRNKLTPGRRDRLLKVLTKEKAKDSLVLKYLQDRIKNLKNGESQGLDITELEFLEEEIKKRMPVKQNQSTEMKVEDQKEALKEISQNQQHLQQGNNSEIKGEIAQLKGKWRTEQQVKTLNPDDDASPKSIYELGNEEDEYDLIVKYNTEQYKRDLQQKFIDKKKQQQLLGESYSQQIEHKKLQKQLEDLQSKRIRDQFDKDVQKFKQQQVFEKLKEKEKIKQQSNMIRESMENYNSKKRILDSVIFNEGVDYQTQASRQLQQEKEDKQKKKQFEIEFFKQLENLTEQEKLQAIERKIQEKQEERRLLQDREHHFNKMDQERYKDKEKVQQKANIIENIIAPSAESHFSTKTQRIANQELLALKQAYIMEEQDKQKDYEQKLRDKELQQQINSILDLQIKQREAQKQQDKFEDIEQSKIFCSNDRNYMAQQNQVNFSTKQQNRQHAEELRKQIEANQEKKQVEKYMSVNEVIYNKEILKNASRDVSDYSRAVTKRDLMLPRISRNIYNSNLY